MSLRDRLHRLTGDAGAIAPSDGKAARINELKTKIDAVMNRRERSGFSNFCPSKKSPVPLENLIDGEEVTTPRGTFFCSRTTINARDVYGPARIGELARLSMKAAALVSGAAVQCLSLEHGLFIDTETTGLSGGTGTFPFLIGLGWFENSRFVICQLFARDFSEEPAMLEHLSKIASERHFLVSFNGKAYDLNLLASRFVLNRIEDRISGMPHIDLLHPSRRIFSHRLENVRLVTLESAVLGIRRTNDVPGQEIPRRYFDWLRVRDGRLMEDVFQHNRMDIASMASLLKHMADLVANGNHSAPLGDLLSVARLHYDRGDHGSARRLFESLSQSDVPNIAQSARKFLSLMFKKTNQWEAAVCIWREMLSADPQDLFAAVEMAKWHEHRGREIEKALTIVHEILRHKAEALSVSDRAAMNCRLHRLIRKSNAGGNLP